MTKLPISAFIIAHNEEDRISYCLESIKDLVDEIIVVDSGSDDNTCEIAKNYGCKVFYNKWNGYIAQKSYAENLCRNKWILNLDADEALSPELQEEITKLFSVIEDKPAYKLCITIIHRLENHARFFAPSNSPIRLYNKELAGFSLQDPGFCHDSVVLANNYTEAEIPTLKGIVLHRSGRSLDHLIQKGNVYSSAQAAELSSKKRNISSLRILTEFPLSFFKIYFLRRYFVFGIHGFVDSLAFAFIRFARLAKLKEIQEMKRLEFSRK